MTWGRDTEPDDAAAQLKFFLEAGGTLVDTADVYGDGDAEAVIGSLLDGLVPRDELLIATKAGLRPGTARRRDGSRGHLLRTLDASLRRLGTDHVDLWQVHGYDELTPLEETLAALDHAVSSGRARYAGVSNFAGWQTARAAAWQAAWPGRAPIVAAQVEYSLLERGVEREVLPACAALGLGVLPWSPLGRGVLTGKYRNGRPADSRAASPHFAPFVQPYLEPRSSSIVEAVVTAASGLGVSPLEVALAWIRDRPGVAAPILGARTAGQLQGALASEDLTLPAEITVALDDVSAIDVGYPERDG
ncbi:aryl-alcohol dehydrogenase-like predicted oxidoreductase [Spirilliplanes yamanashiensis]|nr:aryl-alcohol dehydrogenase-like predicted oxidoreductase [Spirilliplanes yamanashiensis]